MNRPVCKNNSDHSDNLLPAAVGFCLFVLLLATASSPAADIQSKSKQAPLLFAALDDVIANGNSLVLRSEYIQTNAEALIFEAEDATEIQLSPKGRIVSDESASGNRYVTYVNELVNSFYIASPAVYQVWYRAYFPFRANWCHFEKMNAGEAQLVKDSAHGEPKKWLWIRGPSYRLVKGWHRHIFPNPTAWQGGARLDKIVLTPPSEEPAGLGPPQTGLVIAECGVAYSQDIRAAEIAEWRVLATAQLNGGAISVEYSSDEGKTWNGKPLNDELLTPCKEDSERLRLRLLMHAGKSGKKPRCDDLTFEYIERKHAR